MHDNKKTGPQASGRKEIASLIFDLDGVVTQTRKIHVKAWRELFDQYFKQLGADGNRQPSMTENDYLDFIDGKPRYEGVKCFLLSRGIDLPFGEPDDDPGTATISALGNIKNQLFHTILEADGVDVYPDAMSKLKKWRSEGYKTAIVSSSRNCKVIIERAGIDALFDVRVDGSVSADLGLKGKPDPDIFIEAARRLKVPAGKSVVFEDAISGVQAGQRGFFGLVVGVNRFDNGDALLQHGADIIIDDFSAVDLEDKSLLENFFNYQGEPIFPENKTFFEKLRGKKPVVFLDYDGTLTPIVKRPQDAILSDNMREILGRLAKSFTVAIVTGRDKDDVESLVGMEELIYAGSHGYIISGPGDMFMEHPDAKRIIPKLDEIEEELEKELRETTKGTQLDRKRYAIGVHFRNARPGDEKVVHQLIDDILKKYPGHKKGEGKKIVEIKPDIDWHKGKAVEWILEALGLANKKDIVPIFIGDDITDEDAFLTLKDKGVGILVGGHGQPTAASYSLKNVFQVGALFEKLIETKPA